MMVGKINLIFHILFRSRNIIFINMINKPIKIWYFVHKNIIKNIINKFFIEIMIKIETLLYLQI